MTVEPAGIHRLKNQLAIILGFCELLLSELPADDAKRPDVIRMQDAAKSALRELPAMPAHELGGALGASEARRA